MPFVLETQLKTNKKYICINPKAKKTMEASYSHPIMFMKEFPNTTPTFDYMLKYT